MAIFVAKNWTSRNLWTWTFSTCFLRNLQQNYSNYVFLQGEGVILHNYIDLFAQEAHAKVLEKELRDGVERLSKDHKKHTVERLRKELF